MQTDTIDQNIKRAMLRGVLVGLAIAAVLTALVLAIPDGPYLIP